jgi:hypothetical protein
LFHITFLAISNNTFTGILCQPQKTKTRFDENEVTIINVKCTVNSYDYFVLTYPAGAGFIFSTGWGHASAPMFSLNRLPVRICGNWPGQSHVHQQVEKFSFKKN